MDASEDEPQIAIEAADAARSVSQALEVLTETDRLRLYALARLRAKGLPPGASWSDLLHEAIVRALDGSRRWPEGLPLPVFLAGIMRSLCDEAWRRRRREAELLTFGNEAACEAVACPAPSAERTLAAAEAVAAIHRLFATDAVALRIVMGLASGLSAEDIRTMHNLSSLEYDTARRRMRRALLRAGLSWSAP